VDGDYREISTYEQLRQQLGNARRPLHYLAIPPSMFAAVAANLAQVVCAQDARVVIEKPFGRDLKTAQDLDRTLHEFFPETAIFWNYEHVESVQITMAENVGVQGRGRFYEEVGAIRWAGVPFCIRAGKCLPVRATEVLVTLKRPPHSLFVEVVGGHTNYYRFRLNPDFVISLGARIKVAGEAMSGKKVELIAHEQPEDEMLPYERLLGDALRGDATLFNREDAVDAAWRVIDSILGNVIPVHEYEANSWGPPEADAIALDIGGWHNPAPADKPA
jgi:glucose-6-phosphate 1-dehydrogenase